MNNRCMDLSKSISLDCTMGIATQQCTGARLGYVLAVVLCIALAPDCRLQRHSTSPRPPWKAWSPELATSHISTQTLKCL